MAAPAQGPGTDPIEVAPVVVLSQVFPARPSSIPDIREFVRRCLSESPLTDEGNRQVGETVFRALLDAAGPTGSIQVAFRIFPEHVEVDVLHSDTHIQAHPAPGPQVSQVSEAGPAAPTVRSGPAQAVTGGPAARGAQAAPAGTAAPGTPPAPAAPGSAEPAWPGPASPVPPASAEPARPAPASPVPPASAEPAAPTPAGPVPLGQPGQPATFAEWMSTALRREGLTQEAAARQLGVSVKTVSRWVGGATEPRMRDLRRIHELFGQVPFA